MLNYLSRLRQDDKGFTLIELLIVIVVLGILAGIVVFAVGGITDRGQTSACSAERETAETAVEAYYAKVGSYPAAWSDLTTAPNKFLRSAPANYTLGASGAVTATSGGKC